METQKRVKGDEKKWFDSIQAAEQMELIAKRGYQTESKWTGNSMQRKSSDLVLTYHTGLCVPYLTKKMENKRRPPKWEQAEAIYLELSIARELAPSLAFDRDLLAGR